MSTSNYVWLITADHIESEAEGVAGPSNMNDNYYQQLLSGEGVPFQLFDDDNVLYYEGRIYGEFDGFEPLEDWGTPNAGCTTIRYWESPGEWRTL